MQILLIGTGKVSREIHDNLSAAANTNYLQQIEQWDNNIPQADVIIDAHFDDKPSNSHYYSQLNSEQLLLLGSLKHPLAPLHTHHPKLHCTIAGFNNLPTFIDRTLWEVSCLYAKQQAQIAEKLHQMGIQHRFVADRIGMVTPRVVAMIINEAAFTLQENTASIQDIDQAMKLGTNYPYGPFEWADRIGIEPLYRLLEALYQDTHDERYKVCPLLKTQFLKKQTFYS